MLNQKRTGLILVLVTGFIAASLFVHFFHTEKTVGGRASCPACHFQSSSLATGQIVVFHHPDLTLLGLMDVPESARLLDSGAPLAVSRAPPLV